MIRPQGLVDRIFENFSLKVFSGLIALVLWMVVLGSRRIEAEKLVPVELNLPDGLVAVGSVPGFVNFRLEGPKAFLKGLLKRAEEPIVVNLHSAKPGPVEIRFFKGQIELPTDVNVLSVSPSLVRLHLEHLQTRDLPVRVRTSGSTPTGIKATQLRVSPQTVRVRGPRSAILAMEEVHAQTISLDALTSPLLERVTLEPLPEGVHLVGEAPEVSMRVDVVSANLKIPKVSVAVRGRADAAVFASDRMVSVFVRTLGLNPPKVSEIAEVRAFVDATGLSAGSHAVPVKVELPSGMALFKVIPERVRVQVP